MLRGFYVWFIWVLFGFGVWFYLVICVIYLAFIFSFGLRCGLFLVFVVFDVWFYLVSMLTLVVFVCVLVGLYVG